MKITELLKESQIQEGPLTQVIGKGFGKAAKNLAGFGKDLKTGFKAGYGSGAQTPADPNAAAPAPKQGIVDKVKQAASDFKQGVQQGSGAAPAPAAEPEQEKPAANAQATAEPAQEKPATPVAASDDKAMAKLQADFEKHKEDTMTNLTTLLRRISALEKAAQPASDDNPNIVKSNNSVEPTGNSVTESIQLFRK
jgi:hypothetical protein